jgi:hypothetical protein
MSRDNFHGGIFMFRPLSYFVAAFVTVGGFTMMGCQSSARPSPRDHEALFGVGVGEFGEGTTIAGDYASDLHHQPAATQPTASAQ